MCNKRFDSLFLPIQLKSLGNIRQMEKMGNGKKIPLKNYILIFTNTTRA